MDAHIKKVYVPMTETGFYILLCLREPNHGYGIVQRVKEMTEGDDGRRYHSHTGNDVRKPVQDGKRRTHPVRPGRREKKDLFDYGPRNGGPGPGDEEDRPAV